MRRYTAGIYNVFIRNPRLGGTDAAIQGSMVTRVDWDLDTSEDGDSVRKLQVTTSAVIACEETYA